MELRAIIRLTALAVLALPGITGASEANPDPKNVLWRTTPAPPGPLVPTVGQFGGFAAVSSSANTQSPTQRPASGNLRLQVSFLGGSFAGSVPEFSFGDIITFPLTDFRDGENRVIPLKREPVRIHDSPFKYRATPGGPVLTFNPATQIPDERFLWSPHARFSTIADTEEGFEKVVANGTSGSTTYDGFAFASQAGTARMYWRTASPVATEAGTNDPIFGLTERVATISTASTHPVRRVFWTEHGFQGQPVDVPQGEIQQVRFAYNLALPEQVDEEDVVTPPSTLPGGAASLTRRTIWYDGLQSKVLAYNREGRILLEFLGESRDNGLRRHVGIEVVDVIQEAAPIFVRIPVGEKIFPLTPEESIRQVYPFPNASPVTTTNAAFVESQLTEFVARPVPNLAALDKPFTREFTVAGQSAHYAIRITNSASDVQFYWAETGIAGIQWPKFLNRYQQYWPEQIEDYAINVRPTNLDNVSNTLPEIATEVALQLIFQNNNAASMATTNFVVELSGTTPTNQSLLLVTSGEHFWFLRVESVLDSHMIIDPRYSDYYLGETAPGEPQIALVGQRIEPPAGADSHAGWVDFDFGDAIDPTAYIDPFTAGIAEGEKGAIIPVNAAASKQGRAANDNLSVWWFKRQQPPAHLAGRIAPIWFPSFHYHYKLEWPLDAPQIVLASNAGSGDLPADAAGGTIYFENNPANRGFNPNEEHALMIAGRAYALREDLNVTNSSEPYVLVRYTSAIDERPAMRAFRVFRENETYTFDYPARAGTLLQPPMPLAVMPPPRLPNGKSRNTEVTPANLDPASDIPSGGLGEMEYYNRFTYEDRKGLKWVYRGQHNPDGDLPALGMKFYYNTLAGFAFPNTATGVNEAPPVGTITPFLHDGENGDNRTGTSITVNYRPHWPDLAPRHGLKAEFFNNRDLAGQPTLTRYDPSVDFNWPTGTSPAPGINQDEFSARWTGFIVIPKTGDYTFHINIDDGGRLWIGDTATDSTPIIEDWSAGFPRQQNSASFRFKEGQRVPVRFDYYEVSLGAVAQLMWSGPGFSQETIPPRALLPSDADFIEVPSLQFAETLVKPKFGLPGLAGASSAFVLYQQSVAQNVTASVESAVLHDSTRQKVFYLNSNLPELPASAATSSYQGREYFQNLPAHLQERFYFDPAIGPGSPPTGGLVLEGTFFDETVGEDYILLNRLTPSELAAIRALVATADEKKSAWDAAVGQLSTTLETFVPNPAVPGTFTVDANQNAIFNQSELVRVTHRDQAVDSYALTAVGGGSGYVTLILGDGEAFTDSSEPVQMHILRVGPDLYQGQVKPISPPNPLSENLTLQHTGDFGGETDQFEFQWYYAPPVNGQPAQNRPGEPGPTWFAADPAATDGTRVLLGPSQPLITLTDNYFVMRHRPIEGHDLRPVGSNWGDDDGWSDWTAPALAEGCIKRVLAGINPFNQRISDFFNNAINTDVSLLTQAGTRWEGDIPLTLDAVQDTGLIAIYETVLRRGINMTIEGTPGINYGPANDALLLAAGYLNDLYMAFGNEAYADAANPLISLDVDPERLLVGQDLPASLGTTIQSTATARFAFEGQVPTLLDEELVLLRGRDSRLVPGVQISPVYNRFFWNYTRGINAGEVIYALNYNITEKPGPDADGKIDAADAARMHPQGHGDAYGHYLTAVKNYYRLLANSNFTWTPRVEAVNILGVPVTVDYQDERKFAAAAVSLGRSASRILDLERRRLTIGSSDGWQDMRDSDADRAWGVDEWASRAGQGNLLHWAAANAILPAVDNINEGLQKIDRTTVVELNELANLGAEIQSHLDAANRRVNALNLSENSILFDLSPNHLAAGESHFDQVLARAKAALANVSAVHQRTIEQNALLRSLENQSADYSFTIAQQEIAFENRLRDIYGQPYTGDIGPGKLYPQGYTGPDFYRYMFIDRPYIFSQEHLFGINQAMNHTRTFQLPVRRDDFMSALGEFDGDPGTAAALQQTFTNSYLPTNQNGDYLVTYTMNLNQGPYQIANTAMGARRSVGSLQVSLAEVMRAREDLTYKMTRLEESRDRFNYHLSMLIEDMQAEARKDQNKLGVLAGRLALDKAQNVFELTEWALEKQMKLVADIAATATEALPTVVGVANDPSSAGRAAILTKGLAAEQIFNGVLFAGKATFLALDLAQSIAELKIEVENDALSQSVEVRARAVKLEAEYYELFNHLRDIDLTLQSMTQALASYQQQIAHGQRILTERETFRKRAAAIVQGARTRDVAFRAFRTESLEQYKVLFDQAARYTYLAAKAYDYETGQLGTSQGDQFLTGIVSSRALGLVGNGGEPSFGGSFGGDPGLSSYLAKLQADWNVAKGRLGINNPDTYGTLFSLRREHFNLPYREDGSDEEHTAWQDRLRASIVRDLRRDPVIAAHALPTSNPSGLAQPGFVIDLPTLIESGFNHFGQPLGAGDSAFSSASFATKIHSIGVAFDGYQGMDPYAGGSGGTTHNSPDALAATPYVYFLPGGADVMRTPPLNGAPVSIREWMVHDHAMPLPYDIGGGGFGQNTLWTGTTSLSETFFTPRKHQPFRPVADPTLFYSSVPAEFTNRRLIGRSAWNSNWKLVMPAQTLLADPEEGIERFVRSVKDIKIFMRTYSHAGN